MPKTEGIVTEQKKLEEDFFEALAVKEELTYETDPLTRDLEFFDLVTNIEDKDWVVDVKL